MPSDHPSQHHFRAYLILLVILLALAGLLSVVGFGSLSQSQPQQRTDIPQGFPQNAPAPTAQDTTSVQAPFQYVVSYTDGGFRPTSMTVNKGETIRFSNLTATAVQFAAGSAQSSPVASNGYWQYTFSQSGTTDVTAGSSSITVTVH